MGNVAWLAGDHAAVEKKPAVTGEAARKHVAQILAEPTRPHVEPTQQTGWLDGIRVLDLTNVIAGPTIASTLARFGAEVTHVQPVTPSVDPWNTVVFGLQANRGKESVLLNLRDEAGRDALNRLIRQADVITLNATNEQRDGLGLSTEEIARINPDAILVQLDAFGGPMRGPKSDHLGYDDLAQAATGIMVRFGGGADTPEEHAHAGTIDVLAGLTACVSLGGALIQKQATGKVDIARSSLAAAGGMIQAQFMCDFADRAPFDEPSGRAALGSGLFCHCYLASDGWFFWAAPTTGVNVLNDVAELSDLAELSGEALQEQLIDRFYSHPITHWTQCLNQGASAVVPLASMLETRDDALQLESEGQTDIQKATYRAVRHDKHPMGRWCDLAAPNAVRAQNGIITIPGPAPKFRDSTIQILTGLGYGNTQIQEMLTRQSAATSWSARYLPE